MGLFRSRSKRRHRTGRTFGPSRTKRALAERRMDHASLILAVVAAVADENLCGHGPVRPAGRMRGDILQRNHDYRQEVRWSCQVVAPDLPRPTRLGTSPGKVNRASYGDRPLLTRTAEQRPTWKRCAKAADPTRRVPVGHAVPDRRKILTLPSRQFFRNSSNPTRKVTAEYEPTDPQRA
jgi:hypothetical protein